MGQILKQKNNLNLSINLFVLFLVMAAHTNAQSILSTTEYQKKADKIELQNVKNLLYNIQTTIYLEKGTQKTFGEGISKYLKSDPASLSMLNSANTAFSNVEIIEISLTKKGEEKNVNIKGSLTSNFPKLKYLLIKSEFELNQAAFESIISDFKNSNIVLLYEVSIPQ